MSKKKQQKIFFVNEFVNERQAGFGIIEVLISIVIIGIGFLAMASLNTSFKTVIEAMNWQIAGTIAGDLSNRMKLNFVEARKGASSMYNDASQNRGAYTNCVTTPCTGTTMAQLDLFEIYTQLQNSGAVNSINAVSLLPNGNIKVCLNSTGTATCNGSLSNGKATFSIIVTWTSQNGQTNTFLTTTTP